MPSDTLVGYQNYLDGENEAFAENSNLSKYQPPADKAFLTPAAGIDHLAGAIVCAYAPITFFVESDPMDKNSPQFIAKC
ncbi:hypothetical protein ACA910_005446 [Epithemia clementina (nom. ined.)]